MSNKHTRFEIGLLIRNLTKITRNDATIRI